VETLILARHGESEYSLRGLVNGDTAAVCALTPEGERQARALGEQLADVDLDLCVTSAFQRVRETADLALAGRDVPRLVLEELGDPNYGCYEGGTLDAYREWARSHPSSHAPDGGESRVAIVSRYVRAFHTLLERTERTILAVAHSLPIAYALAAREGEPPGTIVPLVEYARPYAFARDELEQVVSLLEDWCGSPTW
jgi:broad specificity phosphatase PhoE